MTIRTATIKDIPSLSHIRLSVKENVLNNPLLVTENDYVKFLTTHGKGWLCEIEDQVTGFAIIDTDDNNIWALFVHPDYAQKGIGRKLHDPMLEWHFGKSSNHLWLSTSPGTRAEQFYKTAGWKATGITKSGEIRFEMSSSDWKSLA